MLLLPRSQSFSRHYQRLRACSSSLLLQIQPHLHSQPLDHAGSAALPHRCKS